MVSISPAFSPAQHSPFSSLATRRTRRGASLSIRATDSRSSFDVVVVGGGIIGLTIARQFLIGSDLSVAVVDKAVPCSGATGAGQGYIWMTHKKPGSDIWDLAMRSHQLWHNLAHSLNDQGLDPQDILGWQNTGSLLLGRTSQECAALKRKVDELSEAGLRTQYLSSADLFLKEPAILVDDHTGAAFLPDDSQLDAHRAVAYIEKGNREFAVQGRYAEFYHEPVTVAMSYNQSRSSSLRVSVRTRSRTTTNSDYGILRRCFCGGEAILQTSRTPTNPGRRFSTCEMNDDGGCHLWKLWDDAMMEELITIRLNIQEKTERIQKP